MKEEPTIQGLRTVVHHVEDVGGGIRHAVVKDPFGNLFGVIENPQFDLDAVR